MAPLKGEEVARYFLGTVDEESGDNITNLKLQKLLYYAQGLHVAMNGEVLFDDPIEAWDLGPVVPNVYHKTKTNKADPIARPEDFDRDQYAPEIREFLDAIMSAYGQYAASKLSEMTHREAPWLETRRNVEIDIRLLREFFSRVVEAGRRDEAVPGEPLWPTNLFRFRRRPESSRRMSAHRDRLRAVARRVPEHDAVMADDEDF